MEVWKDIPGFPWYQVSNTGRVKSLERPINDIRGRKYIKPGKELSVRVDLNGYGVTKLMFKTVCVHILVASAFVEKPDGCNQVNHIDENKLNNNAENLEWCTQKQNNAHGTRGQRIANAEGCPVVSVNLKSGFIGQYDSASQVCKILGVDKKTVYRACKSEKPYKGREWFQTRSQNRSVVLLNDRGQTITQFNSLAAAGHAHGIKPNAIWRTCNNQTKTAGGLRWQYA